ncbi:MAG TPA: cupin domain-containing protein [Steroidobacteraceae bacterium]
MTPLDDGNACRERERLEEYALSAAPEADPQLAAHLRSCPRCSSDLASLKSTVEALAGWPGEELKPADSLWSKLAQRIGNEGWSAVEDELELPSQWPDIEWDQPAPGVFCKVLSTDVEQRRVSLIVRLDPGVEYPPHTHAGMEELHLLDGELWINEIKLYPGEFHRSEPGTRDHRVWSATGCSCVLITSTDDQLR